MRLISKCVTLLPNRNKPELEVPAELKEGGVKWYQELIGQLRWALEIFRVDILLEVAILSQHLALPREGHLEVVLHIFGFLNENPKLRLMFDSSKSRVNEKNSQSMTGLKSIATPKMNSHLIC